MQITIPKKFQKCLAADPKWKRQTEVLTEALSDVLSRATDFFPEYTDHGVGHVNTVLELAAELIPGKSISSNTLSARDAACLVAAIAIHDLGMFLTPAGLNMLMTKDWDIHRNEKLDKCSWEEAWERYVSETKRLPQERMLRCFGRMIEVEKTTLVKEDMTWDDKLVIGEFLRRNHPRLAQEIAKAGLPGSTVQHFLVDAGFGTAESNIIGLIARSHGMSLRKVEEHLGTASWQSNVPVYYLMILLRLADLLDASEDRAPMIRIRQEDLGSPLSKEEWTLNRCFHIDSSVWYPDTKNYTVTATPETSSEYARLEKWLEDAQRELDLCWAALAEKYPEGKLKLSIHRIKCTMHEPLNHEEISDRILPREVKVTANPEIVKLMIEPLYGDDPTYGVRELLQNAVDACVERKEWECKHGNPDYKGFVDVRVEGDTFTITDNGMGMNEDILLNYYLSAGSSYRNSEAWKAANAPDGESQVARTGKFGVGFLASFLLGDEIEVLTQHREDKKGYHFQFDQRSMPLDVVRKVRSNPYATVEGDNAGTTITIKLKKIAREKLNASYDWDNHPDWYNWYAFDEPEVRYTIDGRRKYHEGIILHRDPARNVDWLTLPTEDYGVFQWKPNLRDDNPRFYCNGIRIYNGYWSTLEGKGFQVRAPLVSLIDKVARLDVDLSREMLKSCPEEESLCKEVFHLHIARLLLTPWDTEDAYNKNLTTGFVLRVSNGKGKLPFLLSPRGFTLNHAAILPALSLSEYVILIYEGSHNREAVQTAQTLLGDIPCAIFAFHYTLSDLLDEHRRLRGCPGYLYDPSRHMATVWLREDAYIAIADRTMGKMNFTKSPSPGGIRTGFFKNRASVMPIRKDCFPADKFTTAIHIKLDWDDWDLRKYQNSLFTQTFKEVLTPSEGYAPDDYWIPFDMEERKKKFPKAFEELKVYMDYLSEHPIN